MLADYQREFIDLAIEQGVIRFGEFRLKSGRVSPYFFNAGEIKTGRALMQLGGYYADALVASGLAADCLLGPAYKGIPLVTATAMAMANRHQRDMPYAFNRKEAKDHGEGGSLVGAPLKGDVVIVDDVITSGTAIREVMALIEAANATAKGVLVAIDRQERGKGELSAVQEVERDYGVKVITLVTLDDMTGYLEEKGSFGSALEQIAAYREQYGVTPG